MTAKKIKIKIKIKIIHMFEYTQISIFCFILLPANKLVKK